MVARELEYGAMTWTARTEGDVDLGRGPGPRSPATSRRYPGVRRSRPASTEAARAHLAGIGDT